MKDVYGFLTFEKVIKIIEKKLMRGHTFNPSHLFQTPKLNNTSRNNWKSSFEVNLVRILLKQLEQSLSISAVIVDSAFGLIN